MKSAQNQSRPEQTVRRMFRRLSRTWGPQHWWPAETPFEVIVGAILTQNTSWTNVERAMANLRAAGALSVAGIRGLRIEELEQLIHPSGYFHQKAARLKEFVGFLDEQHAGSEEAMLSTPTLELREQLLSQKGIGPETTDSILLYAGQHSVFVVDAYTRRVLERHDAVAAFASYDEVRGVVEKALQAERPAAATNAKLLSGDRPAAHPPSAMSTAARGERAQVFNEMHGFFVQLGKHYCSKREPKCGACPLGDMLARPVGDGSPERLRGIAFGAGHQAAKSSAKTRV